MKKIIPIIFLTIFLESCSINNKKEDQSLGGIDSVKITRAETVNPSGEFNGLYSKGKFYSYDHPETGYSVVDKTNSIDSIYHFLLPHAYPLQTVNLEAEGTKTGKIIYITKVFKMEQKNYRDICIPYDYWCTGMEPFWQIQISEKENLIDFYDPMTQLTTHFLYSKPEIKNEIIYYTSTYEKNKINITLKKEKCNGAVDLQYEYSAQVTLNDKKFYGCAIKFNNKN